MKQKIKYVLWDWNGTLFDDVQAGCNAFNAMMAARNLGQMTVAEYRNIFEFPVRRFYVKAGFDLANEDWDAMAVEYHRLLRGDPSQHLRDDAVEALEYVRKAGLRQSIISALRQDLLDADTAKARVREYMEFIYGVDNLDGATKVSRAQELMKSLDIDPAEIVLIGDSLHDFETAQVLNVHCILVDAGHQSLANKNIPNARIVTSLVEAVRQCTPSEASPSCMGRSDALRTDE